MKNNIKITKMNNFKHSFILILIILGICIGLILIINKKKNNESFTSCNLTNQVEPDKSINYPGIQNNISIVNPHSDCCIITCLNQFTRNGNFIGDKHNFYASKCGECIRNYYGGLKKIYNIDQEESRNCINLSNNSC